MIDRCGQRSAVAQYRSGFDLTLRRNCSLAPQALLVALSAIALVSLAIGVGFALLGLWLVLPFVGLEVGALAAAFLVYARHVADRECIALNAGELAVEIREGSSTRRYAFNASWVPVAWRGSGLQRRLFVGPTGKQVEIGRHLDGEGRRRLAQDLSARLARYRAGAIQS